ncbi:hypothetical protein MMC18_008530 [Xylographa bjoerkii]|nr:hypothetical protein [Xylographa bjoerkii]
MAAQGVSGPPFPTGPSPYGPAAARPVRTGPPSYDLPEPLGWEHFQYTSRLLSIPSDIRSKILTELIVSYNEIGVNIRRWYPSGNLDRGWIDDMIALRCSCKQLSYETAEVLLRQNRFVFTDIVHARFLSKYVFTWDKRFWANMRNLRLGPYFMVPHTCGSTERADRRFCYEEFLLAMEPFWGVKRLEMTLPWDLSLKKWKHLLETVHTAFPHLTEFTIDRPDVNFLLPDSIGIYTPFTIAGNSYRHFWDTVIANHPMGFEYPDNIGEVLAQDQDEINWHNEMHEQMSRTKVKFTPALEEIRDIWRDSPDAWAPSPGYDSVNNSLVGGEVRRRMFPHHYRDQPPLEPSQQPTQYQPYHFQQ